MSKVLVFFAEGFEEVEALTVVDLLRRAKIDVEMVSITDNLMVTGAHNITISTDTLWEDAHILNADGFILPGGMPGTRNLQAHQGLQKLLIQANEEKKLIGAICAAPLILGTNHLLEGKDACCYPGFENDLIGANVNEKPVNHHDNIITSRGVGTAIAFSGKIIKTLCTEETEKEILNSILYCK